MPGLATMLGAVWWIIGLGAVFIAFGVLARHVVNVVTYAVVVTDVAPRWLSYWAPCVAVAAVGVLAWRRSPQFEVQSPTSKVQRRALLAGLPLIATVAVAGLWLSGWAPTFLTICVAMGGFVWAIDRLGCNAALSPRCERANRYVPWVLIAAMLASTAWHTAEQIDLWRHFMLGHADFGFFTIELEHCLPWKEIGPERFADTRMGYHCVPMFYLLAPFYAVVRSPVFLMFVGPLALNLAAVPFYQLARDRGGSRTIGLLVGLAWLALPSLSRLPYSGTYGFQSIYLAVPWLAWAFALGLRGRWCWSHVCLAGALLCEETVCGVVLGWGVYLMLWGGRRRDGMCIAIVSLVYLALCTAVVIPFFAPSAEYTRLGLFGEVTGCGIIERLSRPRVGFYLLALLVPLLPGLKRGWKVLIAAVPTLLLIALMRDADYLNIKYWHQSSVLPVLFLAAMIGVVRPTGGGGNMSRSTLLGPVLGLLVGALFFHQLMGVSPLTKAYQLCSQQSPLQNDDPRAVAVAYVRAHFPPEQTTVMATERLAAHFTDYRMIRSIGAENLTGRRTPNVLVVDRNDGWCPTVRSGRLEALLTHARAADFTVVHEQGSVLVFARTDGGNSNR